MLENLSELGVFFLVGVIWYWVISFVWYYYIARIYPKSLDLGPLRLFSFGATVLPLISSFCFISVYALAGFLLGLIAGIFAFGVTDIDQKLFDLFGIKQLRPNFWYEEGGPLYFGDGADSFWE